ncbi:MAG: hypothetical protein CMI22_01695 [Opitutae bacterium]|nr:hypothetical protein [Opitutae bacterium]|tara:strand:+ start:12712 stop:13008 length:297 start_codon:yes stop_codon:yes gene_type:complete
MVSVFRIKAPLAPKPKLREEIMKDVISQIHEWIKLVSQVGLGLIALGVIAEIVFGRGAIFGASVIGNLQQIVTDIGGENGFIGLVAILIIFAILQRNR